jgi:hypothetical protein
MANVVWTVEFHSDVEPWADGLTQPDKEALLAAIHVLEDGGPTLGRPLVDTIVGSRHANMKELRPGSTGRSEVRLLFAFDKARTAIMLVGGDKSGDWKRWYETNIPIADDRLDEHQRLIDGQSSKRLSATRGVERQKGRRR